jgi:hypothetical protein
MLSTVKVERVRVCGARSHEVQPKFSVICTEPQNHEGDHTTIYSVDSATKLGFRYSWPQGD